MSRSAEQPIVRRPSGPQRDHRVTQSGIWTTALAGSCAALICSRFFLPAESAAQGETLWIVALWFVCGLVWAIGSFRRAVPRVRLDWLDAAVALWIGSQIVSGIVVVLTSGEKRSAMNMTWEWLSLGVTWLLVRHGIVSTNVRRSIQLAMVVSGTVLAGYGLYQHYVSQPQMVAEYGPLFDRLRTATGSEAASIRQRLNRDGVPTEGPALILFEKRLRDSREPLALFALANTLGGCLAVCLLLAIGEILLSRHQGTPWKLLIPFLVAIGLMSWCLLLTKSRTAFLGIAVGIVLLVISQIRLSASLRRLFWPAALSCCAVLVAAVALIAAGGLDRQVLSEAPKSLAYRFQYWQATSRLIVDHLWLGVGPGNFRQHYLKYKLPVASEEIADPHNLFFDVTATGGVGSGLGLLLFLGVATVAGYRSMAAAATKAADQSTDSVGTIEPVTYWMASGGALLAFAGSLLSWGEWEDRILILGFIWLITAWALHRKPVANSVLQQNTVLQSARLAAAISLAVHLLGAGGIAMPAISQVLVLLLAFSVPSLSSEPASQNRKVPSILMGAGFVAVLAGLCITSLLPVMARRESMNQGEMAVATQRDRDLAGKFFHQAAKADLWSPEPWQSLFEWDFAVANQSNKNYDVAVDDLLEVMKRDPVNFWAPRTLGLVWLQKWQTTRSEEDAVQMVRWTTAAHERYPTNSAIYAELAFALEAAGDHQQAVVAARGALTQDDIYHENGHVDRYLEESIRERLSLLSRR